MNNTKDITEYIMRLARALRRKQGVNRHLPHGTFRLIKTLNEKGSMRTSELAEILDIRPASLTEALTKVEEYGLITRQKDPSDSRMIIVSITPKGEKEVEKAKKNYQEMSLELNELLSSEEHSKFCEISEKLIAHFETKPCCNAEKDMH